MATVSRSRSIPAKPERIWTTVADPEHLPRWWPGVARVEDATVAAWTAVLTGPKGKSVRADYSLLEADHPRRRAWRHEVEASPFERILSEWLWELTLEPDGAGSTVVTLSAELKPRGFSRFGGFQLRRAVTRQIEGALDGLELVAADY